VNLFSDLIGLVSKASPVLGTALGSPLSGVVLTLIANAVKANPIDLKDIIEKLKADPEADIKMKDMETMVNDLTSARNREIAYTNATKHRDWMLPALSLLVALGFFLTLWIVIVMDYQDDQKYFMYAFVIGIGVQFAQVYNYYFGRYNSEIISSLSAPVVKFYTTLFKKP
jgi:lipoprotein signal peptidase